MSPSVNLPQLEVPIYTKPPGVRVGASGAGERALELPQLRVTIPRCGPIIPSLGTRTAPAWQATVAHFVCQVSVGNRHFIEVDNMGVTRVRANEIDDVVVRGRPVTEDGTVYTKADIAAILCNVFDLSSESAATPVRNKGLPVDQVMQTSLQVTKGWRMDSTGYTFEHTVDGSVLRQGGRTYRVELVFSLKNGLRPIKHAIEILTAGFLTPTHELGA